MAGVGSRMSRRAEVFGVAAIAACALIAPAKSYAQADQPIVMTCVYYTRHQTYTLDLARKTVEEEAYDERAPQQLVRIAGTITQITNQEIVWTADGDKSGSVFTLNRFTGDLFQTAPGYPASAPAHCQRQQRKF